MICAALPMLAMLSGCGGGASTGGGVASTPTPTPATYVKIADMTGDRTFQTGGVKYNTSATGFSNGATEAFGSGVVVSYTAATDTYRLTAPDGATATFDPSSVQPPPPGSTALQWVKVTGTTRDQFTLSVPLVNGVPLSYTVVGVWGRAAHCGERHAENRHGHICDLGRGVGGDNDGQRGLYPNR
jgi:hypothetical protein